MENQAILDLLASQHKERMRAMCQQHKADTQFKRRSQADVSWQLVSILGVVGGLIGSSLLSALLNPLDTGDGIDTAWKRAYLLSTQLSFAFILLSIALCLSMPICPAKFLAWALLTFMVGLIPLGVALISRAWLQNDDTLAWMTTISMLVMAGAIFWAVRPVLLLLICMIFVPYWNKHVRESKQLMVPVITSKDKGGVSTETRIQGTSPMHWAAFVGLDKSLAALFRQSSIRVMVAAGCDVDVRTAGRTTPLHLAAYFGNIGGLAALIEAGADVDAEDDGGVTPSYFASQEGRLDVVKALLAWKADVNKPADDGSTPLYMAAQRGELDVVDALLAGGADVNKARKDGVTPLYMAAQEGHRDVVERLLRESEIKLELAATGETPLWVAAECGHADIVKVLLGKGADPNARGKHGRTPLMIAAQVLKLDVEEIIRIDSRHPPGILDASLRQHLGDNLNPQDDNGHRRVKIATQVVSLGVVKVLLNSFRIELEAADGDGNTALLLAAREGFLDAVKALLEKGANINAKDEGGRTALDLANQNGHDQVAVFLRNPTAAQPATAASGRPDPLAGAPPPATPAPLSSLPIAPSASHGATNPRGQNIDLEAQNQTTAARRRA